MFQRVFIAIKPPPEVLEEIINYQKKYLNHPAFRLVEKENIHLTLIFLGYIKTEEVYKIKEICEKISQNHSAFLLNFYLFDYGPNPKNPRLVWLEGETKKEILSLKSELEDELEKNKIKFDKEERDFKAHITIARIRKDFKGILPKRDEINLKTSLKFIADSFILMESQLAPQGAQYRELQIFSLKK